MKKISLSILESPTEITAIEALQHQVWPGSDLDIIPAHLFIAVIHNGGLVIGAYEVDHPGEELDSTALLVDSDSDIAVEPEAPKNSSMVGFVFGFPGIYDTPDGYRLKHHSHMLGVLPSHRNHGIGFLLKRAQWQMVRRQGVDRITWTYDPLLSRNAYLNIARLGGVCNTYIPNFYGELRDDLNAGLSSDRFQVDWWVNSRRVARRLSSRPRLKLDLAHFLAAGTRILNPSYIGDDGLPRPVSSSSLNEILRDLPADAHSLLLVEIPANFLALKSAFPALAIEWRIHTRILFSDLFQAGYLITDFVHLTGNYPRSFYVLSHGDSTL